MQRRDVLKGLGLLSLASLVGWDLSNKAQVQAATGDDLLGAIVLNLVVLSRRIG